MASNPSEWLARLPAGKRKLLNGHCSIQVADCCHKVTDRSTFRLAQVRIPTIDDQHHTRFVAAIPRFMLKGIVESYTLILLPGVRFSANMQCAIGWYDERQMGNQARIGNATMRHDVSAWPQYRKQRFWRVLSNAH